MKIGYCSTVLIAIFSTWLAGCSPSPRQVCSADEDCLPCERCTDGSCVFDEGLLNPCGECLPTPEEICGDDKDNDCDGETDEGCEGSLLSIDLSPQSAKIVMGENKQFTATGKFEDMSTRDMTADVTWESSDPNLVSVSNTPGSEGLVIGLAPGSADITAGVYDIASDPATVTVSDAALISIAVSPPDPTLPAGTKQWFKATGIYSDDSTADLTKAATWTSSNEDVADFSTGPGEEGLCNALAEGTTSITATLGSVTSNPVTLKVTSATLVSIEISPANPNVPIGQRIQLTAFGHYSDQNVIDITSTATWDSTDKAVATVSSAAASKGLATGLTEGTTVISAAIGNITGEATLDVKNIEIVSIVVTPTNASLPAGVKLQYAATATFNDSSQAEVTDVVTWHVGSTQVAEIGNAAGDRGQATAMGVGDTTVWCVSQNGVASSPVALTVTSASLVSITLTPDNPSVVIGATRQFTATGRYTDGSQLDITADVLWESSDETVATISNGAGTKGLATTHLVGATNITATKDQITSPPSRLSVVSPTLESIAATPAVVSIDVGETVQYTATGRYSDNRDRDITDLAYWESTDTSVASVSNAAGTRGRTTGTAEGDAWITASHQGVTSPEVSVNVTQNQAPNAALACPGSGHVEQSLRFDASGSYDDDGTIVNYTFNFSDGTGDIDNGTDPVIFHAFNSENTFTVRLTVTDDDGAQANTGCTVEITSIQCQPGLHPCSEGCCPWTMLTVDAVGNVGLGTSLALDASGHPHITYHDETNGDLKYARWSGSEWDIQAVDTEGDVGWSSSLALDGNGYPHVSYRDSTNADLKYARWTGVEWDIQFVDTEGDVGVMSSLALDGNSNPHISYHRYFQEQQSRSLKYARWTGSTWEIETVDTGGQSSLALDADGSPHISYGTGYLKYAYHTGMAWAIATADMNASARNTSMALGADGNPHIGYRDYDFWGADDLKYARWTGSDWHVEAVDVDGDVGYYASLAVDAYDNPHISYYDATDDDLMYARRTGNDWEKMVVAHDGFVGKFTSLALDADGKPHISYYDATNEVLMYTCW